MITAVRDITGIDLSKYDTSFVERVIYSQMSETQSRSIKEYVETLQNNRNETDQQKKALPNTLASSSEIRSLLPFSNLSCLLRWQNANQKRATVKYAKFRR